MHFISLDFIFAAGQYGELCVTSHPGPGSSECHFPRHCSLYQVVAISPLPSPSLFIFLF